MLVIPEDRFAPVGPAHQVVPGAAELGKLVARDPANPDPHLALATLSASPLANTAPARDHYLKVREIQPDHPQAARIKRWLGPAYRP